MTKTNIVVAKAALTSTQIFNLIDEAMIPLRPNVGFNGYGVLVEPYALRRRLSAARTEIDNAIGLLDKTDWNEVTRAYEGG